MRTFYRDVVVIVEFNWNENEGWEINLRLIHRCWLLIVGCVIINVCWCVFSSLFQSCSRQCVSFLFIHWIENHIQSHKNIRWDGKMILCAYLTLSTVVLLSEKVRVFCIVHRYSNMYCRAWRHITQYYFLTKLPGNCVSGTNGRLRKTAFGSVEFILTYEAIS